MFSLSSINTFFLILDASRLRNEAYYIYPSGFMTAVAVFRKPNAIPHCFSIDLFLNFLFSWLLVLLPSTFFLDVKHFISHKSYGCYTLHTSGSYDCSQSHYIWKQFCVGKSVLYFSFWPKKKVVALMQQNRWLEAQFELLSSKKKVPVLLSAIKIAFFLDFFWSVIVETFVCFSSWITIIKSRA